MIIGYRDFFLDYSYKGFRLRARSHPYVWDAGVNEARCSTSPVLARDHLATGSCTCGFYAFRDGSQLDKYAPVHGAVLMWGTVVEHEFGYRAEFAQLESLFFPEIAICQKASHFVDSRDLCVFVDARPLDPYTACPACLKQLLDYAGGYSFWWQAMTYSQVMSQIAQTYGVPLIKTHNDKISVQFNR